MGNIYYHQQKYSAAIRMYKMALDILPATSKEINFGLSNIYISLYTNILN
jgi:predicted transcriptional regulator